METKIHFFLPKLDDIKTESTMKPKVPAFRSGILNQGEYLETTNQINQTSIAIWYTNAFLSFEFRV